MNDYQKPNLDDLLIQCSLPAKDNLLELFQAIKTTVGWERFLQAAEREGLAELIYYNCREPIIRDLIPPGVGRSLENAYLTTLARNTIFLARLEQIAHALAGLDFIVLKGAYLAHHIYASPGLRRFSDIDILVKQANITEVSLRLAKLGYHCSGCFPPQADPPSAEDCRLKAVSGQTQRVHDTRRRSGGYGGQARASGMSQLSAETSVSGCSSDLQANCLQPIHLITVSSYLNSIMFYPAGTGIALHVHWHLLNSILPNYINAAMDVSEIWKAARPPAFAKPATAGEGRSQPEALLRRSRPRPSADAPWKLCPEHLLIHLAEHALRHSFDGLVLLRDIAEVIIKLGPVMDWDRVVADSRKFNLVRPVFYSLLLIRKKTDVVLPDSALAALRPARRGLGERLFLKLTLQGRRYPELCSLVYFDSMASFGEKIRFVLRLFFPRRDVLALAYGRRADEIGPAVYILRLFRGIGGAARAMVYFVRR